MHHQTPVCPTPGKIDSHKEYFPIRAISKHIIDHRIAILATIHCILGDNIVRAFGSERNPAHKTYDVIHKRLSYLDHSSILPHFFSVGELSPH